MEEKFDEFMMDAKLNIQTTGRDDKYADDHIYPYEPTTYAVLDRVIESGYISNREYLIDYGSGKGRVPIYLNYKIGCRATGIEMMPVFFDQAQKNLKEYAKRNKSGKEVSFVIERAQDYEIPDEATAFFFFNPFSIEIMKSVMGKIIDSYYINPRRMRLFFYYPQDEYVAYLMGVDEIEFMDEIDCMDIFALDESRNKVLVFETYV